MKRIFVIPLLLALFLSQGFNGSGVVCFDQLGQCVETAQAASEDACSCTSDAPSGPVHCEEECPRCHLDHSEDTVVFLDSITVRPLQTEPQHCSVTRLSAEPRFMESGFVANVIADPPPAGVATLYAVRLM